MIVSVVVVGGGGISVLKNLAFCLTLAQVVKEEGNEKEEDERNDDERYVATRIGKVTRERE